MHPALALLAKRKFRGTVRKQVRRAKTPKGAILMLIGLLLFGFYIFSVFITQFASRRGQSAPTPMSEAMAQCGFTFFLLLNLVAALGHRGLYVPKEEIELIFSAPVSRADLVRYRMATNLLKSCIGATFFGIITVQRTPHALYGFTGTFLALLTLPVVGQIVSLLAGDAENRWFSKIPSGLLKVAGILGGLAVAVLVMILLIPNNKMWDRVFGKIAGGDINEILDHPAVQAATIAGKPWARAITAQSASAFLLWGSICLGILILLFEAAARMPVDFRELSLETAANVAKRLQRMRRGAGAGGASAGAPSARLSGWRVPWLFGRGPAGALAWRKWVSIVRKARATLIVTMGTMALLAVISMLAMRPGRSRDADMGATIMIAVLGCIYLCNGLRFDFREDLDRMEFVKTCPVAPWRIFIATLLPESILVAAVVYVILMLKCAVTQTAHPVLFAVAPGVPILAFVWLAIDNIVFLVAPTRAVAGQDTMLQNAGRVFLLMILRIIIFAAVALTAMLPFLVLLGASELLRLRLPWVRGATAIVGGGVGFMIAAAEAGALAWLGGRVLRQFDVAADRG